jgi:DNA-binding PadR family transcriptional regulator
MHDGSREPDDFLPLTPATFHILLALEAHDAHGYRIMKEVEEQSAGRVVIGPGTLYEAIQRLQKQGLVAESEELPAPDEDQRRRYYVLSDLGRRVLRAESARLVDIAELLKARRLATERKA